MSALAVLIALARLPAMPADTRPVAILCLGHMEAFYPCPMLEQERRANRQALDGLVYENRGGNPAATLFPDNA